jgi:hypothetical protein
LFDRSVAVTNQNRFIKLSGGASMRTTFLPALAMAILLSGTDAAFGQPVTTNETRLEGTWKLLALAFGEDEFAIVKIVENDGKTTATAVDAQRMRGLGNVKGAKHKDGVLTLTLTGGGSDTPFEGKLVKEGPDAGRFLGTINYRGSTFPARLEPTKDSKVAPLGQGTVRSKHQEIMKTNDPASRIKKLEEAIDGNHRSPTSSLFYVELLKSAEAARLEPSRVADVIKKWMDEAGPYGDLWSSDVRLRALKAIAPSKSFARLTVGLATDAEKLVSEADREAKASILELLATAARASGMDVLAEKSEARQAKINQELDDEYHRNVPPFSPTKFAGRKNKMADQVILMELFTGAQCPPCVAADVGFDALLKTYKPTEFIGLQYHLHIPGPDPLTNHDSIAREEYYGSEIQGTPTAFFNGHKLAGGGGLLGDSQRKYTAYRAIIDKALEGAKSATIDLTATRTGEKVKIVASATVTAKNGDRKPDGDKPKQVLRLALTEEAIRYVGSNRLRFHHHVVRALPGGADGKELKDGSGKIEVELDLAKLRRDLEAYLSDFDKTRKFPGALPAIKFDQLRVVAFVQDDADKNIMNAVSVPVATARP